MVVLEGMLLGKGEPVWAYTTCPKDFTVVVKPLECSVKSAERIFRENILACDVTEVEEGIEGLDDIGRYITFKCVDEDLAGLSIWSGTVNLNPYLH